MIVSTDFMREALNARRYKVSSEHGWTRADKYPSLWEEFLLYCHSRSIVFALVGKTPADLVDNFLINSDLGEFDLYKKENEADEDFLLRTKPLFYDLKERLCVFHWGIR